MSPRIPMIALLIGIGAATTLAFGQPAAPSRKTDALPQLLKTLHDPVELHVAGGEIGLRDLADFIAEKFSVPVVLGAEILGGPVMDDANEVKLKASKGKLPLSKSLNALLAQKELTFLVRKDHLEIVSFSTAVRDTKSPLVDDGPSRLSLPLISAVIHEKALNEAIAEIEENYDVTAVVSPQAGEAKTDFVSARLLNVPLDRALELLTLQVDLRVLPRGNAYLITSQDHASGLIAEEQERERQQLEPARNPFSAFEPGVADEVKKPRRKRDRSKPE